MVEGFKRFTAMRVWISDILAGSFANSNSMTPAELILQDNQTVNRVALCGIVVQNITGSNPQLSIDDSTGVIALRALDMPEQVLTIQPGTPVLVVGRPRQFMNNIYILIEIIKHLPDVRWLEVWKQTVPRMNLQPKQGSTDDILQLIKSDNTGAGADVDKIIKTSGIPDCENMIADLLLKGVIFEVSPGRVKILE